MQNKALHFESQISQLSSSEVAVLRDVSRFPVYNKEFITSNLVMSIGLSGCARALYDMHEVHFGVNELAVVMPHHILFPIDSSEDYKVLLLVMTEEFSKEIKLRALSHDDHKFHVRPSTILTSNQLSNILKNIDLIEEITNFSSQQMPNRHELLIYQVEVLFEMLKIYMFEHDSSDVVASRSDILFNNFCDLLSKHYRESREVNFYAEKLRLTPKYFARLIRERNGFSASEWIEQYVVAKAKQILSTRSDLTIQQVAYMLGFNEQSAFCRFFKRAAGKSPSDYRKETNSVINT